MDVSQPPDKKHKIDLSASSGALPSFDDQAQEIASLVKLMLETADKLRKLSAKQYSECYAKLSVPEAGSSSSDSETASEASADEGKALADSTDGKDKKFHRKYVLLPQYDEKEYYECETCHQQRRAKNFSSRHLHGKAKQSIRWFCPVCKNKFAVTHRGYHIRKTHPSLIVPTSESTSAPLESTQHKSTVSATFQAPGCITAEHSPAQYPCSFQCKPLFIFCKHLTAAKCTR